MAQLGLSDYDADILVSEKAVADYYEQALDAGADAKSAANWMINNLFALMNAESLSNEDIFTLKITPTQFADLIKLYDNKVINKKAAGKVLDEMFANGGEPQAIVDEKGLAQVSDPSKIEPIIADVLANNDNLVQGYLGGKENLFGALMGQSMKAMKGKGDPQVVKDVLGKLLEAKRE
jgi:aspartyl-tRNA(Asn)/glutamyl-tRNA(Gln) amidotransferase subunit B